MDHQHHPHPQVMGPVTPPHKQRSRKALAKEILSTVGVLLLAPLAAIIFTAFVFQFYRVDGPSMEQTLQNNDRLIVYKLPRTWSSITGGTYLPARGDIVVFNRNEANGNVEESRQLIKRVIALPGERIVIKNNSVTVYNKEHPDGYDPDSGHAYQSSTIPTSGNVDLVIPEGEVFVMGDNRDNSLDSRVFGPINTDDIIGTLAIRVYPFEPIDN